MIVEFLLRRPVGVIMTTIALLVLGATAAFQLPVSLMPEVDIPEITVHYIREDASVNEVENSITTVLRGQLQQIPALHSIHSESTEGGGVITLKFDYGTSIDYAFIEANQKVDAAMNSLPSDMQRPTIIKASTSDIPVFYVLLNMKHYQSEQKFLEFCEFTESVLKKRLEQLPDVAMVDISGMVQPEMYILPDEAKLRSLNITPAQLRSAIEDNNRVAGSLAIRDGYYQYNIKFTSQLMSEEEVREVYLNIEGRLMQIKDIAEVGIRPRDKRGMFLNGEDRALCMAVIKQSDARMSEMKERVSEMLDNFRKEYPDIEFAVSRDQAGLLNYSILNLEQSLIWGIVLAILVMLFFLRDARSPVIIGVSIPVSVVISILFFRLVGLSVNTISLSGLIMGVGMMIDNSIIVIDNINQHRERGEALFVACAQGTREIFAPLLSSVLTTCAVFVPLIFLGGIAGALFYDQAVAVAVGLFVSLLVSVSIVPVIFYLMFRKVREGRISAFIQRISLKHLEDYYTWVYHFVFHHRVRVMGIVVVLLLCGLVASFRISIEQMPPVETSEMLIRTDWNSSIHIDENQRRVGQVINQFRSRCEELSCHVGEKQFFLNTGESQQLNEAEFYVRASCPDSLVKVVEEIEQYIRKSYPLARVEPGKVENLFEQLFKEEDAPLIVFLAGESRRQSAELEKVNTFIDRVNQEMPALRLNRPAIQERVVVELLPERLALYKVDQTTLLNTLEKNISKIGIGKLNTGSHYIPIVMTENERTIREVLEMTTVSNQDRQQIPVTALTRLSAESDYKKIMGRKEGVVVPVHVYNTGDSIPEIMQKMKAEADRAGMEVHFGGSYFEANETFWKMLMIVVVAILMLYFILATQFESLKLPWIVLIEIPVDVAVTVLLLWICGISLNLMSMIGIIVMCGIVINDSILKIDTIIQLQRKGLPLLEAIHEGGVRRLKPILMTSLTTIIALVPFLWGNDIGSQLQRPLAVAMIGGMMVGTIVSLYWVPLCYYYLKRAGGSGL